MTESKSWLWKKKLSDKTVVVAEKEDLVSKKHKEEIRELLAEKAQLESDLHELDGKLANSLSECTAKDELAKKHTKTAKEALSGWEKAEAKSLSLKQELDEAVKQRDNCEDRARHLDAALKECMQQLRFVREDQEQRIHDVLLKSSEELEETKMYFKEKLEESGDNIAKLSVENSQLGKILSLKDQLIEDLNQQMAKAEADINTLLARLENVEKDNNNLRYEVRVLEKEVDIRNEEKEFNRRTADSTQKQHLENVRKIAKLETECQRLRVLVRKRLPGPADMAKMKSEVNILHRKSNLSVCQLDYGVKSYPEASPGKNINILTDRISTLEDDNHVLHETLEKNLKELQISRNMYLQTATKLSQVEAQLEELAKLNMIRDIRSLASMSDVASDDKSVAMSDINHFMDDFAEMEKLALVCVDKPTEKSPVLKNAVDMNSFSESAGKDLVLVSEVVDGGKKCKRSLFSSLSTSISKLIENIQGINLPSEDNDHFVRVFQWKTSELTVILQKFLGTCYELLNGKAEFETFSQELTSALEWILNHCFSLQDMSITKDEMKKQIGLDETKSESEIASLQVELEGLKKSKSDLEDQFDSNAMMIEDLNVQLLAVKCKMQEGHKNFAVLEGELIGKANQCEELETKCLDLQVQLESATKMDTSQHVNHDRKKLETGWEMSAASETLAQCQETILHLGKQIQAMSTSRGCKVSDKFMSTPTDGKSTSTVDSTRNVQNLTSQRSSLFDKLQADNDENSVHDQLDQSPETKKIISAQDYSSANKTLAIVPIKKQPSNVAMSGGLFKKLLWRKKKNTGKRLKPPFAV